MAKPKKIKFELIEEPFAEALLKKKKTPLFESIAASESRAGVQ